MLSSLETSEYPNEAIRRSWLYECLKSVPKLALKIDKFKEAAVGDSIRSYQWLWQSMIDCIDESQHDGNTASILNALRSNFQMPHLGLLITLYVDDIVVSGPAQNHQVFWRELASHLHFEKPQIVSKVLGRTHLLKEGEVVYDMSDFAEATCKLYESESKGFRGFKKAPTPYLDESTLPVEDWDSQGHLAHAAAKLVMKAYWLARLSRPDLLHSLNELSKRITTWSLNDDRRLYRVFCYPHATKHYRMSNKLDPTAPWELLLFTEADHASKTEHGTQHQDHCW